MLNNGRQPVPLLPHHGMCLAYFAGYGYSDSFTLHMGEVLSALSPETLIRLTVGTDCVCTACPNNLDGVCDKPELVAAYDRSVLSLCGLQEGQVLPFGSFTELVQNRILAPELRPSICGGCQWNSICSNRPSRWENSSQST